ncbi:hypothetical protein J2Z44_001766 [Clostridium punense]|uniref:ABC transporter permease n=1 Tax=Clostridium punense TaxID=1054297 RepID=A0ABS4K2F0_9CLOT|nr:MULTISPECIES: ABC transporter permease [Clostridium]EQB90219.1 hypothetical protein M918_01690 [Clostridium sp. BL8]MBP2021970.1 hypothetical protein [Clostridium punense]
MLMELLKIDFLKVKKNFIWKFIILVPFITAILVHFLIILQFKSLNELCRSQSVNGWIVLIGQNSGPALWPSLIAIIIMIISITIYQIEFKGNSFNAQVCFPVSRSKVFIAKFMVIFTFVFIVIVLNILGLIVVGIYNHVTNPFPLFSYIKYLLAQCCSVMGIIAISNWISSLYKNPMIPYIVGVFGFVFGLILPHEFRQVSYFFPYAYPQFASGFGKFNPLIAVLGGTISGIIILGLSICEFNNRDIQ